MSLVKMRSSWICLGSNPMTGHKEREMCLDTGTRGRWPFEDRRKLE